MLETSAITRTNGRDVLIISLADKITFLVTEIFG